MTLKNQAISILFSVLLLSAPAASAGEPAAGFQILETLRYDLRWIGLKAGSSSMSIVRGEDKRLAIVSTAKSAGWVSVFYPVEDLVVSRLEEGSGRYPVLYQIKTREGNSRKDKEVRFHQSEGRAEYIDNLKQEKFDFPLPQAMFDPLSGFYQMRRAELTVGESSYVPIFDSKRIWNVEVKVLKKERVKVPAGSFDTVLIKPILKSEGIFSRKGDIYIWLTDDERKVPVKVKTEVLVGSIIAELVGGQY
jgi:hypothetical protein